MKIFNDIIAKEIHRKQRFVLIPSRIILSTMRLARRRKIDYDDYYFDANIFGEDNSDDDDDDDDGIQENVAIPLIIIRSLQQQSTRNIM